MCQTGLFKAIKYFGSQQALAKAMGVTQQTVSHWLNREQKIPDMYVFQLFVQAKGYIPLRELVFSPQAVYRMLEKVNFYLKFPAVPVSVKAIQTKDFVCPKVDRDNALIDAHHLALSHPILIDTDHQLIACECRLRAHKLLGDHTVLAHKIHWDDVINGNFPLAPLIQSLPISEKVAVGLAIERKLGNRQGNRTDLQPVDPCSPMRLGTNTRIAAMLTGFNNGFLYRQAKIVVAQGLPALIHAMDEQTYSIRQAKKIALLPQQQQSSALVSLLTSKKS